MTKITKDTTLAELIEKNPKAAFVLMESGLMCGACPMAQFETIEQGCAAHGINTKKMLKELNSKLKEND